MKKYFLLFLIINLFISCSQNEIDIDDSYSFNGRGGIKCEVDGVLLKPSTAIIYGNASLNSDSTLEGIPFMSLSFHNSNQSTGLGFQVIRILLNDVDSRDDLTGLIFELKNEENGESYGEYSVGGFGDGATNDVYVGELEVIYHDVDERILGGTFWYDVVNTNGEIREIRNGEFDMKIW
ncbi:hypothetical protein [Psychroserpens damuponensis]|uniref:hypothetical protein n=1 Tax=Psychroserpens damuponensis TaxID=943936 RepID=UPI00058CBDC9|nr:hypothetical protein [Psychroserpens damuponensis]